MLKTLLRITKPDELNFISPCGLGDTMLLNGIKHSLERKYGLPVHFIIKPPHKIVMEMYGNTNYSVHKFSANELTGIGRINRIPQKGRLYVAHPMYTGTLTERWQREEFTLRDYFFQFFGIENGAPVLPPSNIPVLPAPC
ncbi:MAG: hypothetical protein LBQ88_06575 [Treponema sp.]|jgi:hypothetical protein|nr:hypothetical protein [Treponema sp.]